jgi:hypothetical protein
MQTIKTTDYYSYTLEFKPQEFALRESLMEWLPDDIIDVHAHSNLPEHVERIPDQIFHHMMSTFPSYQVFMSTAMRHIFFPGKRVRSLRFANAYRGIDHRAANAYLLSETPPEDRMALYGIPDDIDYTVTMLKNKAVHGLKMYYYYFVPPAQTIYEVFPPAILEEAQHQGIPIILHLPKMITKSHAELYQLLHDFPRLTVVLAHLGLPHLPVPGLLEAYEFFAQYPQVYMDTAMIPSWIVVAMAIKTFGSERIMYGSDEPLHMIRSVVYKHPTRGQRLATEYPYHWVDPEDFQKYKHLATNAIHTHWQALNAIRLAVENTLAPAERNAAKEAIFERTGRAVYSF